VVEIAKRNQIWGAKHSDTEDKLFKQFYCSCVNNIPTVKEKIKLNFSVPLTDSKDLNITLWSVSKDVVNGIKM
jgi:hypothetical protein